MKTKTVALLSTLLAGNAFADARSQLVLENNCTQSVTFNVNGDNAGQDKRITLSSGAYINIGDYINNKTFSHTTSNISINYSGNGMSGSVLYKLENGWAHNYATFTNMSTNIEVEHNSASREYKHQWHSYTVSGKLQIPTFTVTSCKEKLDLSKSDLKDIKRVLIFGDSLSDQGNLYDYSQGAIPRSTPYYKGSFTNGNPWSVLLSNRLKLNNLPVSNYAVGGATAIFEPQWTSSGLPYNLTSELSAYKVDKLARKDSMHAAIFFIGANDYLTMSSSTSEEIISKAAQDVTNKIIDSAESVHAAKTIIIGLPDLSQTIESKEKNNQKVLSKVVAKHNAALIAYANARPSRVKYIDLAKIFDLALNNVEQFNEQYHTKLSANNLNKSCWTGGYFIPENGDGGELYRTLLAKTDNQEAASPDVLNLALTPSIQNAILAGESGRICSDPEKYVFYDHVHPTYQIHKALYQYISQSLGIKTIV
jgi:phospholipase/lecithinase/hemolysin